MNQYFLWIVVLTPLIQEKIAITLLNNQFKVGALSGNKMCDKDDNNLAAYNIAMLVETQLSFDETKDTIRSLLKQERINFLSFIFVGYHNNGIDASWSPSTYLLEQKITES